MSAAYGYGGRRPAKYQATGTTKAAIGYVRRRQPNAFPSNWCSPEKAPKASRPTSAVLTPASTQKAAGRRMPVASLFSEATDPLAGEPDGEHERDERERGLLVPRDPLADPPEPDRCPLGRQHGVEDDRRLDRRGDQ